MTLENVSNFSRAPVSIGVVECVCVFGGGERCPTSLRPSIWVSKWSPGQAKKSRLMETSKKSLYGRSWTHRKQGYFDIEWSPTMQTSKTKLHKCERSIFDPSSPSQNYSYYRNERGYSVKRGQDDTGGIFEGLPGGFEEANNGG